MDHPVRFGLKNEKANRARQTKSYKDPRQRR